MKVNLSINNLSRIHAVDPMLTSYNIEMTEITGGTFWKAYTPKQLEGKAKFWGISLGGMMQYNEPIDLYNERLRKMAKGIPGVWVRVSGSWATKTYYDFSGNKDVVCPKGYENVLTKEQWIGVLDFVKDMKGKLLISLANCAGNHTREEVWNPEQAKLIIDFSKEYGVPVDAIEFVNEPNYIDITGYPKGYTVKDYGRDFDFFARWLRKNYPEILIVGPSSATNEKGIHPMTEIPGNLLKLIPTKEMLAASEEKPDIFSYHYYNGVSERVAFGGKCYKIEKACSEDYLSVAELACKYYKKMSSEVTDNGLLWVTESGDAACGGHTWGSRYLDVIRSANELGVFTKLTEGVIFHNTFVSSDYGWLDPITHLPRPNYWFNYVWNILIGENTFETGWENCEGAHIFAYDRKDGKTGYVYMVINNSKTEETMIEFGKSADVYLLSSDGPRSKEIYLNGKTLTLGEEDVFPVIEPMAYTDGNVVLPPVSVAFVVV